jgi:hypothetical protein
MGLPTSRTDDVPGRKRQPRDVKKPTSPDAYKIYSEILQKGYTPLKSRELEELPRFRVMSWQPFQLPWSASLCLFK